MSDLSAFIGHRDPATHRILAAGDLNLYYGATGGTLSLPTHACASRIPNSLAESRIEATLRGAWRLASSVRYPPCGRRRAPRSPTSGPIPGERDRFRPLAPPVAVWAAFWGRFADVAAAAGSRAVGRRWAWRCAGLVRQA